MNTCICIDSLVGMDGDKLPSDRFDYHQIMDRLLSCLLGVQIDQLFWDYVKKAQVSMPVLLFLYCTRQNKSQILVGWIFNAHAISIQPFRLFVPGRHCSNASGKKSGGLTPARRGETNQKVVKIGKIHGFWPQNSPLLPSEETYQPKQNVEKLPRRRTMGRVWIHTPDGVVGRQNHLQQSLLRGGEEPKNWV